jgi:uncharacterized protein (TIGR00251 family)
MKISETKDGFVLDIFVKPNSSKFEVAIEDEELVVRCTEEPVKGKVNKEIVKELSKLLRCRVEIISGLASRQKRIIVKGLEKQTIENLLNV